MHGGGADPERTLLQPDHFSVLVAAVNFQTMHIAGDAFGFGRDPDKDFGIPDGGPVVLFQDGGGNAFSMDVNTVVLARGQFHAVLNDMQFRMVFSARLVRLRYDQIVILRPSDGQRFVRIVDQDRLKQFAAATECYLY